ncbi:hypothetical protein ACFSUE_09350 [Sporolactobacillus shoreicorticis]|uniref:Uncharacterized protein n=1 Tax=Sporolactobacillus shoreicorticis TaxID=1923877 RepID=A0ABW5S3V3_9BACL
MKGSDSSPALNFAYSYDHSENITKISDPDGDTSAFTYNDANQILTKKWQRA